MTTVYSRPAGVPAAGLGPSIVDVFGHVVARRGEAVALTADGSQVTYREMWARSGAVAQLLMQLVPLDPPHVALLVDQGIDAIVGILGVLRAGLAYVCLDPQEPPDRQRFICSDVQAGVLLTAARHADRAREIAGVGVRVVDVGEAQAGDESGAPPRLDGDARSLLVYTSGSTGQPKGVIHTHASMLWVGNAFAEAVQLDAGDRLTLLSSLSFGAANTDIYSGLQRGATLCLYDTRRLGVDGLPAWLAEQEITVFHAVPSVFRYAAQNAPVAGYPTVKAVDLAGEPVYGSDVRLCLRAFPNATRIVNRYAATESTVISQYVARPGDELRDEVLPVGIAARGAEVLIVDEDGVPSGPGDVGEIVVRGRYLSRGYWNRPDLTAAAFSDDPDEQGVRRYRTGDAGRLDPEGVLTVLGRVDGRVKIRGQSIEPAEIEAALRSLPGVRDAFVDVERLGGGADAEARLVGYVVPDPEHAPTIDAAAVYRALGERVPLYMIPSRVRVIEEFPQTRTGKIDRQALRAVPESVRVHDATRGAVEPPQDDAERVVAAIYARILGVPVTSRTDDFFMLGGTSMTLAQLQTALRREVGSELELADVVRSATVAGVAAAVTRGRSRPAAADVTRGRATQLVVPLRPEGAASPLFLVHGWHGQAYVTPGFLDAVPVEHPVYSIQARGLTDGQPPLRTVSEMAAAYLAAIRDVGHAERPILVGICAGGVIAIEMASQARAAGGEHLPVVMLDPPFPPYARPLAVRMRDLAAFYFGLAAPQRGPARAVTNRVVRRLRTRAERIGTPELDYVTLQNDTAVRVALSVGIALRRHRPGVYEGPIRVIASERRLSGATWRSDIWRRVLAGPIELIGAGEGHLDTLNPANVAFRAALRRAIGAIDGDDPPADTDRRTSTAADAPSWRAIAADDGSIG